MTHNIGSVNTGISEAILKYATNMMKHSSEWDLNLYTSPDKYGNPVKWDKIAPEFSLVMS